MWALTVWDEEQLWKIKISNFQYISFVFQKKNLKIVTQWPNGQYTGLRTRGLGSKPGRESFLDETLLLTVPLSNRRNESIPTNFPGEMQRVISDGRASHPGEVAVLLVVSCYTVRNRFQCLVGHLDQVQVLPLHFTFPVRQWQSTTFMVVTWQLVTELALILRSECQKIQEWWLLSVICGFSLGIILKFWNVFQRAFPHCFLCVQYTSLRKKTFTLFFISWMKMLRM